MTAVWPHWREAWTADPALYNVTLVKENLMVAGEFEPVLGPIGSYTDPQNGTVHPAIRTGEHTATVFRVGATVHGVPIVVLSDPETGVVEPSVADTIGRPMVVDSPPQSEDTDSASFAE